MDLIVTLEDDEAPWAVEEVWEIGTDASLVDATPLSTYRSADNTQMWHLRVSGAPLVFRLSQSPARRRNRGRILSEEAAGGSDTASDKDTAATFSWRVEGTSSSDVLLPSVLWGISADAFKSSEGLQLAVIRSFANLAGAPESDVRLISIAPHPDGEGRSGVQFVVDIHTPDSALITTRIKTTQLHIASEGDLTSQRFHEHLQQEMDALLPPNGNGTTSGVFLNAVSAPKRIAALPKTNLPPTASPSASPNLPTASPSPSSSSSESSTTPTVSPTALSNAGGEQPVCVNCSPMQGRNLLFARLPCCK